MTDLTAITSLIAPTGRLRAAINVGNPVLAHRLADGSAAGVSVDLAGRMAGVGLAQWCQRHGVDGRSLQAWSLNLGMGVRRTQAPGQALVELVADRPSASGRYVLRVGPVAIEVDDSFDEAALRRLLAVVSSC